MRPTIRRRLSRLATVNHHVQKVAAVKAAPPHNPIVEGYRSKRFIHAWLPVLLWMGVIFALSSIPGQRIPKVRIPHLDKAVHAFEFLVLNILLMRAFLYPSHPIHDAAMTGCCSADGQGAAKNFNLAKAVFLSIIVASIYAALDEWHQYFIPDRIPDIFDFSADIAGIIIGALIYRYIQKNKRGILCR